MDDAQELAELRRLAELEAKAGGQPSGQLQSAELSSTPFSIPGRPGEIIQNASRSALASVPDMFLNAPSNLWNLSKAAAGTAATALGHPELAPSISEPPNFTRKVLQSTGIIKPQAEPQTTGERLLSAGTQGATAGAPGGIPSMVIGGLTNLVGQGATEATGNPNWGLVAALASQTGVNKLSDIGERQAAQAKLLKSKNEVEDATLAAGRQAGFITPPSAVDQGGVKGFINRRLESFGGKAAIKQQAGGINQEAANTTTVKDLGLPEGTALSSAKLNDYRDIQSAPYKELASIDPAAASTLEALKQTRAEASLQYDHYAASKLPSALKSAQALRQKASGLESQLEAMAFQAGKPDLVPAMQEARRNIAKSFNYEEALNVGNADISAPNIGKQLAGGAPLSGGAETIGKFANAFPQFTTEGAKIPTPGVSKSEMLAAAILGGGGYGLTNSPYGMLAGALPFASGAARSLVLSPTYQKLMATRNYSPTLSGIPDTSPNNALLRAYILSQQRGQP